MIIGKQFVENQYDERLYSTGNDELDELLERAFCEGYELGQREFGNPQNKAAKRDYEARLGGFGGVGTLGRANTMRTKHPQQFQNIKDAAVSLGRSRQNPSMPNIYTKLQNVDQKVNARGVANTNILTGRPIKNYKNTGEWKATSENIKYQNNKSY